MRAGQSFLSLSLTPEPEQIERIRTAHAAIGLDWGVSRLLTGVQHDGSPFDLANPRWYQADKDRIAKLQQALARKKHRSKHRKAAAIALAKVRAHQARKRLDFLHKESAKLAGANALVAMEKLAIRNMTRSAAGTVEAPGTHVAQKGV